MVETGAQRADRKQWGAWYTPPALVDAIVDAVVTPDFVRRHRDHARRGTRPIAVLDPACGDGRFLEAVGRRLRRCGAAVELVGVDLDPSAVDDARRALPEASIVLGDALERRWWGATFDLVIGNPPFLSQMAASTTRGGAGARGAGTYADAAVEFLALGAELVEPDGGRLAFVLPQSVLASRDATAVREAIDRRATMFWSSWSADRMFDAQVHTCVVAFEFDAQSGAGAGDDGGAANWSSVVTARRGVPDVPTGLAVDGVLGDRATLNANFRDEYYGMVDAVGDGADGPRLITSGLIDPGRSRWGERPIRFNKHRFERPRLDLGRLDERMREWARRRLVPKVLVANQTRILEAVCDPEGDWLPAVPVVAVYPRGVHWDEPDSGSHRGTGAATDDAWRIAAVLTSPVASAWSWHRGAGTGLSADTIRTSPAVLGGLPWPAGDLRPAVDAIRVGDVRGCGAAVDAAYGIGDDADLARWWTAVVDRIEQRDRPRDAVREDSAD